MAFMTPEDVAKRTAMEDAGYKRQRLQAQQAAYLRGGNPKPQHFSSPQGAGFGAIANMLSGLGHVRQGNNLEQGLDATGHTLGAGLQQGLGDMSNEAQQMGMAADPQSMTSDANQMQSQMDQAAALRSGMDPMEGGGGVEAPQMMDDGLATMPGMDPLQARKKKMGFPDDLTPFGAGGY